MFTNMYNCRVSYKLRYNMRHICLPICITAELAISLGII